MIQEQIFDETFPQIKFPTSAELPSEDGVPLESSWHRAAINLLIDNLNYHWQGRQDYYTGGNMFIYFSTRQIRNKDYRGPDFFVVKDVDGSFARDSWVVWEEDGRYPDLIIELLSPSTAETDKTTKKRLYEQVFRTTEYYCYDPSTQEFLGWHLQNNRYEPLIADENGRLWSAVLQAWIGEWQGSYLNQKALWLRFFDEDDGLIATTTEAAISNAEEAMALANQEAARASQAVVRANQEAARASQEAARASQEATARQAAEEEVARLRALLAQIQG